jgi:hypothetical protein
MKNNKLTLPAKVEIVNAYIDSDIATSRVAKKLKVKPQLAYNWVYRIKRSRVTSLSEEDRICREALLKGVKLEYKDFFNSPIGISEDCIKKESEYTQYVQNLGKEFYYGKVCIGACHSVTITENEQVFYNKVYSKEECDFVKEVHKLEKQE